jgi:hypothetical protein
MGRCVELDRDGHQAKREHAPSDGASYALSLPDGDTARNGFGLRNFAGIKSRCVKVMIDDDTLKKDVDSSQRATRVPIHHGAKRPPIKENHRPRMVNLSCHFLFESANGGRLSVDVGIRRISPSI